MSPSQPGKPFDLYLEWYEKRCYHWVFSIKKIICLWWTILRDKCQLTASNINYRNISKEQNSNNITEIFCQKKYLYKNWNSFAVNAKYNYQKMENLKNSFQTKKLKIILTVFSTKENIRLSEINWIYRKYISFVGNTYFIYIKFEFLEISLKI